MVKVDLTTGIKVIEMLVEQNISGLEKIQNNVKRMRYMGRNLILILASCLIGAYIFVSLKYLPRGLFMIMGLLPLFVFSPLSVILMKKSDQFLMRLGRFLICLWMLTAFIMIGIHSFPTKPTIEYLVFIPMGGFCFILCYSLFVLSKEISETFLIKYLSDIPELRISLLTGVHFEGKLKTITKKNDFVLETDRGEILIKHHAISYIVLRDAFEKSS